MFEDMSDVVETGAIAQRRRMGDRHELNALRTRASAVRPPEPPTPSYSLKHLRSPPNAAHSWRGKETQASFQRFRPRIKKNGVRTRAFRPFRDLSWKLFIPALMGRAPSPAMGRNCREGWCVGPHPDAAETAASDLPREGEVWRRVGLQ